MEFKPLFFTLIIAKIASGEGDELIDKSGECDAGGPNGFYYKEVEGKKIKYITISRFITETTISEMRRQGVPVSERKVSLNEEKSRKSLDKNDLDHFRPVKCLKIALLGHPGQNGQVVIVLAMSLALRNL